MDSVSISAFRARCTARFTFCFFKCPNNKLKVNGTTVFPVDSGFFAGGTTRQNLLLACRNFTKVVAVHVDIDSLQKVRLVHNGNIDRMSTMNERKTVAMSQSLAVQENIVLPGDTNAHDTLFGGLLMKHIDETAAISARRHSRGSVVTASNDGVHFHQPIQRDDIVILESYVCSVGRTSMEIFVKILTESSAGISQRQVAAISFLTFVSLDENGKPSVVPLVEPDSEEEKLVFSDKDVRKAARLKKRQETNGLISSLSAGRT